MRTWFFWAMIFFITNSAHSADPSLNWKFETAETQNVIHDTIVGNSWIVDGVEGKALKFDGISSYLKLDGKDSPEIKDAFTVHAWIALGAYPWNWCPIIEQRVNENSGFLFGINSRGNVGLFLSVGKEWVEIFCESQLDLRQWYFVAAVFESGKGVTLFIDGEKVADEIILLKFNPANDADVLVGRNSQKLAQSNGVRKDSHQLANILFDGVIDELDFYDQALSPKEIQAIGSRPVPQTVVALPKRVLPAGRPNAESFGAFYQRLEYYQGWDAVWRVTDYPDVLVQFDQLPIKYVFWRGTSYIPNWVTENGIWYNNEFTETWGRDVHGCAEPMSDKQCRHSNVRIIENTDARVVIHWRYALVDVTYGFAKVDPATGWGDWCDEIHTIYPDGTGIRKITLHSTNPEQPHEWHEGIVVMGPGFNPENSIEPGGLTLANTAGQTRVYSWDNKTPPKYPKEPKGATIQRINTKSKFKPFTAARTVDNPVFDVYAGEIRKDISMYPWWNHWPTAFQPSDGRYAQAADRASHSSLTHMNWGAYEKGENWMTKILLHGMSDKSMDEIVQITQAWDEPVPLEILSDGFEGTYDQSEKAYLINRTSNTREFKARIDSAVNPAFILKNWGTDEVKVNLNSKPFADYRFGFVKNVNETDLLIWLEYQSADSFELAIGLK